MFLEAILATIIIKGLSTLLTDDSCDVSYDDLDTISDSSGPSREEVQDQQRQEIYADAKNHLREFIRRQDQFICFQDSFQADKYADLINKVENLEISAEEAEKISSGMDISNNTDCWVNIESIINHAFVDDKSSELVEMLNTYTDSHIALKENFSLYEDLVFFEQFENLKEPEELSALKETGEISIPRIERHVPIVDTWDKYNQIQDLISQGDEPRVVVCGLLKAGKSTLLNMLTNHLQTEIFVTKATRATVKNQQIIHDGLCYVDTPGLDAPGTKGQQDTEEAEQAYFASDLLLFVHMAERELTDTECEILHKLKKVQPELEQKIIFVLTYAEGFSRKEDRQRMIHTIQKQLEQIIGINPSIFCVANSTYKRGAMEGKDILKEVGGVDSLRKELFHRRDNELAKVIQARLELAQELCESFVLKLMEGIQDMLEGIQNQEEKRQKLVKDFYCDVIAPVKAQLDRIN